MSSDKLDPGTSTGKKFFRYPLEFIRRSLRYLTRRARRRVLILAYHRIFSTASDPHQICVSPQNFREQIKYLSQNFTIHRLSEVTPSLEKETGRRTSVAITFDDGYRDNLKNAKKILEEFRVPATVFVISGEVGRNRRFWWDELERLVLAPTTLPSPLILDCKGRVYRWERQTGVNGPERWSSGSPGTNSDSAWAGSRVDLHGWLHDLIRYLGDSDRWTVLRQLKEWSALGEDDPSEHRAMTVDELRQLEDNGLLEVGSHTLTHPVLATLPSSEQSAEILGGKELLERLLGHPVKTFAYPFGANCDFTAETVNWIREAGVASACTLIEGTASRSTPPLELPRLEVRNWGVQEFARNIKRLLG